MEGIEYYRALYKYIPKETDDTEDADQIPDIPLDKDDILEVKHPISDDIQKPKGWLIGYNKNQKLCGYFPGPYVEHITPQMVQMAPQIGYADEIGAEEVKDTKVEERVLNDELQKIRNLKPEHSEKEEEEHPAEVEETEVENESEESAKTMEQEPEISEKSVKTEEK